MATTLTRHRRRLIRTAESIYRPKSAVHFRRARPSRDVEGGGAGMGGTVLEEGGGGQRKSALPATSAANVIPSSFIGSQLDRYRYKDGDRN